MKCLFVSNCYQGSQGAVSDHGSRNTQMGVWLKQKSSPDKSDELLNMIVLIISRSWILTYLSAAGGWNWHLFITGGYKRLSRLLRAITLSLS